jgi:CDP-glucose 4,6-dehydratase
MKVELSGITGIDMFEQVFKDKKILITGHTGFKGSWLTTWLLDMGAEVCGVSNGIPTNPSMFEELNLEDRINHQIYDICDQEKFSKTLNEFKPDFLFHLAAQPIVSESYLNPKDTIVTNVIGTTVVLDCLKDIEFPCNAVIITSDKCYENVEWLWGYKETDQLGGKDIYSASKGAAEVIFKSYYRSFFESHKYVRLATGRAGNVIGGGDWAKDRIVVDCVKAWSCNNKVTLRCPDATRPWQHVLEPLSGYLTLAQHLSKNPSLTGEQFNFGPKIEKCKTVENLLCDLAKFWEIEKSEAFTTADIVPFNEAGLLKLNCDKALSILSWEANMKYDQCIEMVGEWYKKNQENENMYELTISQIHRYCSLAQESNRVWAI